MRMAQKNDDKGLVTKVGGDREYKPRSLQFWSVNLALTALVVVLALITVSS
jgi:hypothetical protein